MQGSKAMRKKETVDIFSSFELLHQNYEKYHLP